MTDEQFEYLMKKLEEINQNIILITSKEAGQDRYNLSDVCSELTTINSSVSYVETAVNTVNTSIRKIDLS